MNTYVVLLRQMPNRSNRLRRTFLEAHVIADIGKRAGVRVTNLLVTDGIFGAVIVCRASGAEEMIPFFDGLEGWSTEALLATSHTQFEPISDSDR